MASASVEQTKVCTKCGLEKDTAQFAANKLGRFGRQSRCRSCANSLTREWKAANKARVSEYNKAYKAANPQPSEPEYKRRWYLENRERILQEARAKRPELREKTAQRRSLKRDHIREVHRLWREANRAHLQERARRRKAHPKVRLENAIREGVRRGIQDKGGKGTFAILGYSPTELMVHLERQFRRGMSWANFGQWHVDHIIPLSSFSYQTAEDGEFRAAWALANLRPMWGVENIKKGAKRLTLL